MIKEIALQLLVITLFSLPITDVNFDYVDRYNNIDDHDERLIKDFRSHHEYSKLELFSLQIKYLDTINGYKIYYVPYKGKDDSLNKPFEKADYTFPIQSNTRIIGIKGDRLYTLVWLINMEDMDLIKLYELTITAR
ncbi:hypothetical protein SAMN03159341_10357 [Paenibacillus sp. 1_12]|uniref:hypothetical protein n=1 Tax=Paenibacillus sp. 1_12 TaxID=1566278 RepID=UPI0008E590E8|nr:hypothetical protein [Paenibacillus sp. 1_12]SFL07013.1 hypothetical protein SAMN03159341_10357 [Paenibacillus sp. 1_12]